MFLSPLAPNAAPQAVERARDATLRSAAQEMEAAFLSEMLKHSGLGKPREDFGGGIGESQFSSFLRDLQAREMAEAGGLGLAEQIFRALKARDDV